MIPPSSGDHKAVISSYVNLNRLQRFNPVSIVVAPLLTRLLAPPFSTDMEDGFFRRHRRLLPSSLDMALLLLRNFLKHCLSKKTCSSRHLSVHQPSIDASLANVAFLPLALCRSSRPNSSVRKSSRCSAIHSPCLPTIISSTLRRYPDRADCRVPSFSTVLRHR